MARAFETAQEMEFIVAGSHSEFMVIFKCCEEGAKISNCSNVCLQKGRVF